EKVDPVAQAFNMISRRVPGVTFGTPKGRGIWWKNRLAVEKARLQRQKER
ncbi:unnamed protein product, partial [Choristocarpus tenellus]